MLKEIAKAFKETRADFAIRLLTIAGKRMQKSTDPTIRAAGRLYVSPAYHAKIREYALSQYILPVTPKRIAHNVRLGKDAYMVGAKMAQEQILAEDVIHRTIVFNLRKDRPSN